MAVWALGFGNRLEFILLVLERVCVCVVLFRNVGETHNINILCSKAPLVADHKFLEAHARVHHVV